VPPASSTWHSLAQPGQPGFQIDARQGGFLHWKCYRKPPIEGESRKLTERCAMPFELHVIRASEFVRLDADKNLNFEASVKALQSLAQACRKRGLDRALLDLRAVPVPTKPAFTTKEIAALVLTFRDAGFSREQRLSVLYHEDVHGGIRDFAFISRMGGLQVQAFHDFERALQWLSEVPESGSESQEGEVAVRITKRQTETKKVPVSSGRRGARASTSRTVRKSA